MNEKKEQIKRLLHDNVVTLVTVLIFVLILGVLLAARYGSLLSIANIANINPLITNESTKLVAVNVNGVIKIIKDGDGKVTEAEKKVAANDKSSTTNKSNQNSGGSGGAGAGGPPGGGNNGGGTGGNPPGGGTGGSPGGNDDGGGGDTAEEPAPFSASVTSLEHSSRWVWGLLDGYTCTRTFKATVKVTAASGSAKLRWVLNDTTVLRTTNLGSMSSGDTKNSDYTLSNQPSNGKMTVKILNSDDNVIGSRDVNFGSNCS